VNVFKFRTKSKINMGIMIIKQIGKVLNLISIDVINESWEG
jgi:hypothetical protein